MGGKPKVRSMPAAAISQEIEIQEVERMLVLHYISPTAVKGFDKNRKRTDIWNVVIGDWDWKEKAKEGIKWEDFERSENIPFSRSVVRDLVELVKEVLHTEFWYGIQAARMIQLHDRFLFILDGASDGASADKAS